MGLPVLDRLPPVQRQLVMIGVPIVAVIVMARVVRGRSGTQAPPSATGTIPGVADVGAIDNTAQINQFEDQWAEALNGLQTTLSDLVNSSQATPVDAPANAVPAPTTAVATSSTSTVSVIKPNGEKPNPDPGFIRDVSTSPSAVSALDRAVVTGVATQTVHSDGSVIVTGPASLGTGPTVTAGQRIAGERYVDVGGGKYRVIL